MLKLMNLFNTFSDTFDVMVTMNHVLNFRVGLSRRFVCSIICKQGLCSTLWLNRTCLLSLLSGNVGGP